MIFRYILTISVIFLFLSAGFLRFASAQDDGDWILRFQITPGISGHHLLNKDDNPNTVAFIEQWNNMEDPTFTWQTDVSIARKIGQVQIVTGFGFSQIGFKVIMDTLNYGYVPPSPYPTHYKQSVFYQGIEWPVQVHYETHTKKWSWFVEGGGGLNWVFNQHIKSFTYYSDDSEIEGKANFKDPYEFDHLHPFVKLSTGIGYQLCERWKVNISPTASYYFVERDKSTIGNSGLAIAPHLYFIGINAGTSFSF